MIVGVPVWALWAIVAAALAIGEVFTPGLFFERSRRPFLAADLAPTTGAVDFLEHERFGPDEC
jgi:membrane protein implicated in regulation of membrane protease activity